MAQAEHVHILKSGSEAILNWRGQHFGTTLDATGASLGSIDLSDAPLSRADFSGADLESANLKGADLFGAILVNAKLRGAALNKARLSSAVLTGADFTQAHFVMSDLTKVIAREAVFTDATFSHSDLGEADFTRASFQGAEFFRSIFRETNLSNASVQRAILNNVLFFDVDLREVRHLDSVEHRGPSEIGVSTLYRSLGQIPHVFLRGCGVPESLITYLHSLTRKALEFYSCFISYTQADDSISERLYNDLQAASVRCWRWREDAKWGRTLMGEVDHAIRLYDKLVVILSEQSLQSEPVIREIERALQKESRDKKEVLFPIRVDDAIFSWQHGLQPDVVRKVMGDFRDWTDPAKYKASLKRLIECLQAPQKTVA
ncbi:MAG TPA: toll/interleukin-1 receptor domain-containing protein [Pirellulaceae bacterium]|nr:toll/interleukin-1 receptor domain-containing protein [Pirellulaceae bacterium]